MSGGRDAGRPIRRRRDTKPARHDGDPERVAPLAYVGRPFQGRHQQAPTHAAVPVRCARRSTRATARGPTPPPSRRCRRQRPAGRGRRDAEPAGVRATGPSRTPRSRRRPFETAAARESAPPLVAPSARELRRAHRPNPAPCGRRGRPAPPSETNSGRAACSWPRCRGRCDTAGR